jgi:hypothetical protein
MLATTLANQTFSFMPQAAILAAIRCFGLTPTADLHSVSHRGVVAGQDFDDRRIDGYHSS